MNKSIQGKRLAEFYYLVERAKIRELAEAIGDPNPIYRESGEAQAEGYPEIIAPPTFGTAINLWGGLGFSEICNQLGANPIRVLHAEQDYEYFEPVYAGEALQCTMTVAGFQVKEGRAGEMHRAVLETIAFNQKGLKVLVGRSTILEKLAEG
jgi:acyl dehydratase